MRKMYYTYKNEKEKKRKKKMGRASSPNNNLCNNYSPYEVNRRAAAAAAGYINICHSMGASKHLRKFWQECVSATSVRTGCSCSVAYAYIQTTHVSENESQKVEGIHKK